jgi:hypothetical protein
MHAGSHGGGLARIRRAPTRAQPMVWHVMSPTLSAQSHEVRGHSFTPSLSALAISLLRRRLCRSALVAASCCFPAADERRRRRSKASWLARTPQRRAPTLRRLAGPTRARKRIHFHIDLPPSVSLWYFVTGHGDASTNPRHVDQRRNSACTCNKPTECVKS